MACAYECEGLWYWIIDLMDIGSCAANVSVSGKPLVSDFTSARPYHVGFLNIDAPQAKLFVDDNYNVWKDPVCQRGELTFYFM